MDLYKSMLKVIEGNYGAISFINIDAKVSNNIHKPIPAACKKDYSPWSNTMYPGNVKHQSL